MLLKTISSFQFILESIYYMFVLQNTADFMRFIFVIITSELISQKKQYFRIEHINRQSTIFEIYSIVLIMSKTLEAIKVDINKARNLTYFGKYMESMGQFNRIIAKVQQQIFRINDKILLEQWNKLLEILKHQRGVAESMVELLAGNFNSNHQQSQQPQRVDSTKQIHRQENFSQNHQDPSSYEAYPKKPKFPFGKEPFKKHTAHQDDQLYNRKQKQMRDQERQRYQKEQRDRQFEERQAEIWPKKQPTKPKKKPAYNVNANNVNANKSNVNNVQGQGNNQQDKRSYNKPWQQNIKKNNQDEKKTFLKHCYPDGAGPDSDLIQMLERQVVDFSPNITFNDIAQLEKAKDVLEQAVLLPLAMPQLFTGIRRAWKGVLLFGPPGTGKTLLAKAIASSGKTTFFNVTASSLASKWKGQSEKLVRILFEMAKFYAPTTIFIDQIDALASKRGQKQDQSSRKVKTQLMTRIDGASTGSEDNKLIVVVGATNRPWDLDQAIRRRLQKRIYIPLPTQIGRRQLIRINLKNQETQGLDIQEIVRKTDGYSGADIANLCRQAAYMPMRRKLKKEGGLAGKLNDGKWMEQFEKDVNVPLSMEDFNQAIRNVKPSVGKGDLANYDEWMKQFGEQGTK